MSALREWAAATSEEAHKASAVSSLGKWKTTTQVQFSFLHHPSISIYSFIWLGWLIHETNLVRVRPLYAYSDLFEQCAQKTPFYLALCLNLFFETAERCCLAFWLKTGLYCALLNVSLFFKVEWQGLEKAILFLSCQYKSLQMTRKGLNTTRLWSPILWVALGAQKLHIIDGAHHIKLQLRLHDSNYHHFTLALIDSQQNHNRLSLDLQCTFAVLNISCFLIFMSMLYARLIRRWCPSLCYCTAAEAFRIATQIFHPLWACLFCL